MGKLQYTFKTDTLFKMLFAQNENLFRKPCCGATRHTAGEYPRVCCQKYRIVPEILGEKFCCLDISGKDSLTLCLSLFQANRGEKLERIRELEVPEMEQGIEVWS